MSEDSFLGMFGCTIKLAWFVGIVCAIVVFAVTSCGMRQSMLADEFTRKVTQECVDRGGVYMLNDKMWGCVRVEPMGGRGE